MEQHTTKGVQIKKKVQFTDLFLNSLCWRAFLLFLPKHDTNHQRVTCLAMLSKSHSFQQEHRELAREAVRKSLVLLKNGKSANETILPLPKKAKNILVAGSHADNLGYQCGGWTIQWQGESGNITVGMSLS